MQQRAHGYFLTVTELADVLVRSTGMSFRIAHEIVSLAVDQADGASDPEKDGLERRAIGSPSHRENLPS